MEHAYMKATKTSLSDVIVLEPKIIADDRGFFMESYNANIFSDLTGSQVSMVQDNHSRSNRGVLRGLHYQIAPAAQGKLVRVIHGEIFDVAVDIRRGSPSFGRWVGITLSAENRKQLWIPPGFAHGFYTLSESAEVVYKASAYYSPQHDRGICWNDGQINILWPLIGNHPPTLSSKDTAAPSLAQAEIFD